MPPELQSLGDNYVRDEFKRHKKCNESEAQLFMIEWTQYAINLSENLGLGVHGKPTNKIGKHLEVNDLDKFKEDQIIQLYELMKATTQTDENDGTASVPNSSSDNTKNKKS